ncbi:MAG: hypothetical protein ABSF99_12100 [Anaerolineales bacterium]|jgi:hypothetical protein
MTFVGSTVTESAGPPCINLRSCCPATRPTSSVGAWTVVKGGTSSAAKR